VPLDAVALRIWSNFFTITRIKMDEQGLHANPQGRLLEQELRGAASSPLVEESAVSPPSLAPPSPSDWIEADEFLDDEGYAESTTTDYVSSIASEIRQGIVENGRVYAAYGQHKPWVPVDNSEVCFNTAIYLSSPLTDFSWTEMISSIASSPC
jgi:hypothetical protein